MPLDSRSERRLRRGLEELSPLFQSSDSVLIKSTPPSETAFEVQFLTVCVPDREGDAFLANAYVASQAIQKTNLFASLVSVEPGMNSVLKKGRGSFPSLEFLDHRISRVVLSHQELLSVSQNGFLIEGDRESRPQESVNEGVLVFLEFEPSQFRSLARLSLLLDRVVLFSQPDGESMREGYRLIKTLWNLNREIEFYLLFQGGGSPEQEEFLFERFSLILSRFLGFAPRWLGDLSLPRNRPKTRPFSEGGVGFDLAPILDASGLRRPLRPEKNCFWQWFKKTLESPVPTSLPR